MKKSMLSTAGLALLTVFSTNCLMATDLPALGQGSARLVGAADGAIGISVVRAPAIISGSGGAYIWTDHRQGDLVWRLTRALEDHERHMHTMLESQQTAVQNLLIQFGNLTARLDQQDRIKLIEQQFYAALDESDFNEAKNHLDELAPDVELCRALSRRYEAKAKNRAQELVRAEFLGAQDAMPARQAHTAAFLQQLPLAYQADMTAFSTAERLRFGSSLNATNPDFRNALLLGLLANF